MAAHEPTEYERTTWEPEQLLREAQTNVTSDHHDGYAWAEAALQRSHQVPLDDPETFRGRTLAVMAIRGELAGVSPSLTDIALKTAHDLLARPEAAPREIAAVAIAGLRVAAIRLRFGAGNEAAGVDEARTWFKAAETTLEHLHAASPAQPYFDRYWTMLMRHAGVMEALSGNHELAAQLARRAIYYAERADAEEDSNEAHLDFVIEQVTKAKLLLAWFRAQSRVQTEAGIKRQLGRIDELLGHPDPRDQ